MTANTLTMRHINGRYNGAMSRYAIDAIRANPGATFEEFFAVLRQTLPSQEYPQTPQLEGSDENKSRVLFVPLLWMNPHQSQSQRARTRKPAKSPGCIPGLMRQISRVFKGD